MFSRYMFLAQNIAIDPPEASPLGAPSCKYMLSAMASLEHQLKMDDVHFSFRHNVHEFELATRNLNDFLNEACS